MKVVEAVVFVLFKETFLVGKWHVTSPRHCHCLRLQADRNHFFPSHGASFDQCRVSSCDFSLVTGEEWGIESFVFIWKMSDVQPLQRETVHWLFALNGILCEAFLTSFDWDKTAEVEMSQHIVIRLTWHTFNPQLWSCRQISSLANEKRIHPACLQTLKTAIVQICLHG